MNNLVGHFDRGYFRRSGPDVSDYFRVNPMRLPGFFETIMMKALFWRRD